MDRITSVSRRSAMSPSRYRSACRSGMATSSRRWRARTASINPRSTKSSGRALAAGSKTSSRAQRSGAKSKSVRMTAEDRGEAEREQGAGSHGATDGMEYGDAGEGEHTEPNYCRHRSEKQRNESAGALLRGER